MPLKDGEPSVAILLLGEADHHKIFPCGKSDIKSRVLNFTKSLVDVATADTELSGWLHHKKERMLLSPGLRYNSYTRWTVQIQPAVGEPFLGAWKAYLRTVLQQQQAPVAPRQRGSSDEESGPTPKRPKLSTVASPRASPRKAHKRAHSGGPPLYTRRRRGWNALRLRWQHSSIPWRLDGLTHLPLLRLAPRAPEDWTLWGLQRAIESRPEGSPSVG